MGANTNIRAQSTSSLVSNPSVIHPLDCYRSAWGGNRTRMNLSDRRILSPVPDFLRRRII
jgi:hypothetical protein